VTDQRQGVLIRQLQGALGGNRIVAGGVTDAGAVNYGPGFSATKTGTGLYTVTYDVPFSAQPSLGFGSDQGTFLRIFYSSSDEASVDVVVQNAAGAAVDAYFSFQAIGT
jgi:hypothetical protein